MNDLYIPLITVFLRFSAEADHAISTAAENAYLSVGAAARSHAS
ncbi:hypothetical protein [Alkalicoccus urumqiensis]|nr:hypothetical protein [Alkalicoccus urumqiensis]